MRTSTLEDGLLEKNILQYEHKRYRYTATEANKSDCSYLDTHTHTIRSPPPPKTGISMKYYKMPKEWA